jgi:hypothetical protein
MNLAQAMLAGRSPEAFLSAKRSQEANKRVRKSKTIAEHTPKEIYQFERLIPKVDGEMTTKDNKNTFMGKLNPEKFSQRLQDLNRYLDFIPIEKTSDSLKITKAYGKSLSEDDIRSFMGCAIPPEWTVHLLVLGK